MKIREILKESEYTEELSNLLVNILIRYRAEKVVEIPTHDIMQKLKKDFFDIDLSALLKLLSKLKIVSTADKKTVKLKNNKEEVYTSPEKLDQDQERVSQMAKREIDKGLKNG